MSNIISKKNITAYNYGKAITVSLSEIPQLKQLHQALCRVKNWLDFEPKIKALLLSPLTASKVKKTIFAEVIIEKFDQKITYFLEVLIDNNDLRYLDKIIEKLFEKLLKLEEKNLMEIVTAAELIEAERKKVEQAVALLNAESHQKIYLTYKIDEKIRGGYIVYFKDKIYDFSLKSKFNVLKRIINELVTV
jgi:ATP synthase F1 delta subunit